MPCILQGRVASLVGRSMLGVFIRVTDRDAALEKRTLCAV